MIGKQIIKERYSEMIEEWRKNTTPTTVGWKIAQVPFLRIPRRIDPS